MLKLPCQRVDKSDGLAGLSYYEGSLYNGMRSYYSKEYVVYNCFKMFIWLFKLKLAALQLRLWLKFTAELRGSN